MSVAIRFAAAPLAVLLWLSGAVTIYTAFAVMLVFAYFVLLSGVLLARVADAADLPLAGMWVLGVCASAAATYALVELFDVLAGTAFAAWCVCVLASAWAWRKHSSGWPRADLRDLLGFALCAAATVAWCWQVAEVPQILVRDRMLPAWTDYFIHGGVISHFGDPRAGRQSMFLADFPAAFYHYASYLLPAALAVPLDLPGLPLATSFWLPLGFFTMCAGAYALGKDLAGPHGGIAAVAALTVVPDASNYALRNGFLSFHWHLLAFPGSPYTIGLFLVAIALLQRWFAAGRARALLASAGLAAGALVFRVHFFALGFPALLASAAMASGIARRHKTGFFAASVALFALFVWAFYALTDSVPALEIFLVALHDGYQEPTGYTGWYAHLLDAYGRGVAVPVGMFLVLAGSLGVFLVLFPMAALLARRSARLQAIDLVPVCFIGGYLLIMLTAPKMKWDSTELTVRPFVLLYAVLAVWTFAWLARWLAAGSERKARAVRWSAALASFVGLLLLWPHVGGLALQPKFQWGWRYFARKVEPGVPEAAAYLRRNSVPGDLLAVEGLSLRWVTTDLAVQLASLTGMPAYLGYVVAQLSEAGPRRELALKRHAVLGELAAMETAGEARARLRQLGIQWYVVPGERGPRWDPQRREAAFVEGRIAVYAAGRS